MWTAFLSTFGRRARFKDGRAATEVRWEAK
jgi:hypothetical protein